MHRAPQLPFSLLSNPLQFQAWPGILWRRQVKQLDQLVQSSGLDMVILLTKGDIFPTASSSFIWIIYHNSCQLINQNNSNKRNNVDKDRERERELSTWWKWLQKRIKDVVRPTRIDAQITVLEIGNSLSLYHRSV